MTITFDRRQVRSYVIRAGRMTPGQSSALENQWARYGLEPQTTPLALEALFTATAPLVLEIGFGMGDSLFEMVQQRPQTNFIGVEVHRPGVGHLLHLAAGAGVENLRVFCTDSMDVLRHCLPANALDTLQVFFPDPWHKKKHHKRRLINTDFLTLAASRLKVGGVLHFATDWAPYAEVVADTVAAHPGFVATAVPARPLTKYERRGLRLGHEVFDMAWSAVAPPAASPPAASPQVATDR
ncbi:MAG: tRNA (guanosine(46)-N7)-methyltransferase TrmB [Pseudomonadales bacterium]|jgi:tRNA (guanine-N7-)-methyltransferase|nr:tRNA (guanosine(46)-N7)-methyltransferase TrmB [Pseudomonadales bacterium]MDP4641437.1 tRNA (guanosine(46)-N7)-methyltransferase TrmB [Pseudomonadales bacterium]MDP4766680.1 tRNA (guanosine(46)-N7)-methyltransferase TrmB [Pseudomonadales bacterium]MDP4911299.1 tRNA (guanosine(46)-N7)-methyltransferase TrmB [Pseudomonadales bacterium]MDP5057905.1 tRNA (guanosine(46)-N7)-methyltransferase TrmB [Pseudomonadales bacterium]